jgi:hypothetical protein
VRRFNTHIAHFCHLQKKLWVQINKKQCQSSTSKMKSGLLPLLLQSKGSMLLALATKVLLLCYGKRGQTNRAKPLSIWLCFCPSFFIMFYNRVAGTKCAVVPDLLVIAIVILFLN